MYTRTVAFVYGGLAALSLLVAACDLQSPTDAEHSQFSGHRNGLSIYSLDSSWMNPNNPHNGFGVVHNSGLDYVNDHTSLMCAPPDNCWKYALRDYFVMEGIFHPDSAVATFIPSLDLVLPYCTIDSIPAMYDYMGLTIAERDIMNRIYAVCDLELSREEMLARFTALEDELFNSTTLGEGQKKLPYVTLAIGKASTVYWFDRVTDSLLPATHARMDQPQGFGKTARNGSVHDFIKADLIGAAAGAVGGFLSGAVVGFFTGLVTTGPGAIATAASGALIGSAGGAISVGAGASVKHGLERSSSGSNYGGRRKK